MCCNGKRFVNFLVANIKYIIPKGEKMTGTQ